MKTMAASVASKEFGRYLDSSPREPVSSIAQNSPKLRIELGLNDGLEDIEHGRFEEISNTSTATRIARFKKRINNET